MKASDAIARFLSAHGVHICFELIGGMITHIVDSLSLEEGFEIISVHHEQAAAFAAEGVARKRAGKQMALAMGTSGPGATNLMTGIGSCWLDSIPSLFITGQVNTSELKGSSAIRQQGFQELDIVSLAGPITKSASQVLAPGDLLPQLHHAMSLAFSGRMGPVLLDIPNDVQRMDIPDDEVERWLLAPLINLEPAPPPRTEDLKALSELCQQARKPLFCLGGGARWVPALNEFVTTLQDNGIPYVSTLMGQEHLENNRAYFNMIGAYGNREANRAVQEADLLIVLGARLDIRQTGADAGDFARNAKIVQVDIDPAQLNNRVKTDLSINCGVDEFMRVFFPDKNTFCRIDPGWMEQLAACRKAAARDEYPDWALSPSRIFSQVNDALKGHAVDYVCDVGNHQMWAAHSIRLDKNQAIHHNGGMGAMGFALPAAIGMCCASDSKVMVITGDGSLQVNIQELDTVARLAPNLVILVMNNYSLGMVKNFQDLYFDGRDQSTMRGYSCPSFAAVAQAFGIDAVVARSEPELASALQRAVATSKPLLIELIMEGATECRPRLAFGKKLDQQLPEN
jgi:acetolactate synthase I/II/III large subunit